VPTKLRILVVLRAVTERRVPLPPSIELLIPGNWKRVAKRVARILFQRVVPLDRSQIYRQQDVDLRAQFGVVIALIVHDLPPVRQKGRGRMRAGDDLRRKVLSGGMPLKVAANQLREPGPVPLRSGGRVDAHEASSLAHVPL